MISTLLPSATVELIKLNIKEKVFLLPSKKLNKAMYSYIRVLAQTEISGWNPGFGDLPLQISNVRRKLTNLGYYISEISDISGIFPFAQTLY